MTTDWGKVEAVAAWLAIVVTLGIALVGWARSNRETRRANEHATAAEARAEEAMELARSAESRADRLEQQALERRDVAWQGTYIRDRSTLSYRNIGTDTAHDVELVVYPARGGPARSERFSTVPPGDLVGIRLESMVAEAQLANAARSPNVFITVGTPVHVRLVWRSASGIPSILEERDRPLK